MDRAVSIREAHERDLDALTDVWERAARSSHGFMGDDELIAMRPFMRDAYLPSMEVWLAEADGVAIAFVGTHDTHVELLYVDPPFHGQGLGSRLLAQVGATSVEVYESNEAGLGFYRSQGFTQVRRRTHDAAGRPFPMVVLQR